MEVDVSYHIYKYRIGRDMTLAKLSKKSGVSVAHINEIENGLKHPTVPVLCKLAKALEIPCANLFSYNE